MAINRRRFIKRSFGALFATPLLWLAERVAPVRYTEALRARFYPGAVRPMDPAKVRQPGKWVG